MTENVTSSMPGPSPSKVVDDELDWGIPPEAILFLFFFGFFAFLSWCIMCWRVAVAISDPQDSRMHDLNRFLHAKSRRLHIYLYAETKIGDWIDTIQTTLSVLGCALYVAGTYQDKEEEEESVDGYSSVFLVELAISGCFILDWILRFFLARDKLKYLFSFFAVVDIVTILPVVVQLILMSGGGLPKFTYVRLVRVLKVLRILRSLRIMRSAPHFGLYREVSMLAFTILVMIFCAAGIYQVSESQTQPISLHYSVYLCAIETLGRPRLEPSTDASVVVLLGVVFCSVVLIPRQLNSLLNVLYIDTPFHRARYKPTAATSTHVVVVGQKDFAAVTLMLYELFHPDRRTELCDVVLLLPEPPDRETQWLLEHPAYNGLVQYLVGSPLVKKDLQRAQLHTASAVFILCDKDPKDAQISDCEVLTTILSCKNFVFNALLEDDEGEDNKDGPRILAQAILPETRDYVHSLPGWRNNHDVCLVISEFLHALMALGIVYHGISTLIFNLISHTDYEPGQQDNEWFRIYEHGAMQEVYSCRASGRLIGMTVQEAGTMLLLEFDVVLIAADLGEIENSKQRQLILFPGNPDEESYMLRMKKGDRIFCLAQDFEELMHKKFIWDEEPGSMSNRMSISLTSFPSISGIRKSNKKPSSKAFFSKGFLSRSLSDILERRQQNKKRKEALVREESMTRNSYVQQLHDSTDTDGFNLQSSSLGKSEDYSQMKRQGTQNLLDEVHFDEQHDDAHYEDAQYDDDHPPDFINEGQVTFQEEHSDDSLPNSERGGAIPRRESELLANTPRTAPSNDRTNREIRKAAEQIQQSTPLSDCDVELKHESKESNPPERRLVSQGSLESLMSIESAAEIIPDLGGVPLGSKKKKVKTPARPRRNNALKEEDWILFAGNTVPRLKHHVVICGNHTTAKYGTVLTHFLRRLFDTLDKPVAYLGPHVKSIASEVRTNKVLLNHLEEGRLIFVEGSSMKKVDLLRVSVHDADEAVLFAGETTTSAKNQDSTWLGDGNSRKMRQQIVDTNTLLKRNLVEHVNVRIWPVTQLLQESTVNLFYGHEMMQKAQASVSRLPKWTSSSSASAMMKNASEYSSEKMKKLKQAGTGNGDADPRFLDIRPINMSPLFAAGQIVACSMLDRVVVESFFNPKIILIIGRLMFGDSYHNRLFQVPMPPSFVTRIADPSISHDEKPVYRELCEYLLIHHRFLPVGLFRFHKEGDGGMYKTFSNPLGRKVSETTTSDRSSTSTSPFQALSPRTISKSSQFSDESDRAIAVNKGPGVQFTKSTRSNADPQNANVERRPTKTKLFGGLVSADSFKRATSSLRQSPSGIPLFGDLKRSPSSASSLTSSRTTGRRGSREETQNLPFVVTNPEPDAELASDDLIFVIGHSKPLDQSAQSHRNSAQADADEDASPIFGYDDEDNNSPSGARKSVGRKTTMEL